MGIFDPQRSKSVDIRVALDAAVALGQAGDPRIVTDLRVAVGGEPHAAYVLIPAGEYCRWAGSSSRVVLIGRGSLKRGTVKTTSSPERADDISGTWAAQGI
jgi:hypothetical protein